MSPFQVDVVETCVAVAAAAATAAAFAVLRIGVFLLRICRCAGRLGVVWEGFSLWVVDDSLPLLPLLLLLALLTRQLGVPVVIDCGDLVCAAKDKDDQRSGITPIHCGHFIAAFKKHSSHLI